MGLVGRKVFNILMPETYKAITQSVGATLKPSVTHCTTHGRTEVINYSSHSHMYHSSTVSYITVVTVLYEYNAYEKTLYVAHLPSNMKNDLLRQHTSDDSHVTYISINGDGVRSSAVRSHRQFIALLYC